MPSLPFGPAATSARRHGRHDKSDTLDDIERFGGDVARATAKVAPCEQNRDRLSDDVAHADAWHDQHDWRRGRLAAIETELRELGHIDLRRIPLPDHSPGQQHDSSRTSALRLRLRETVPGHGNEVPTSLGDRLAEIAAPPLPGRDAGLGMDLGL